LGLHSIGTAWFLTKEQVGQIKYQIAPLSYTQVDEKEGEQAEN
jgi:hypothetical protein